MNDELREHLVGLERRLLSRDGQASAEVISQLLADDFQEFGSSGRVFTKADVVRVLPGETHAFDIAASDVQVTALSAGVVLVTYRSERRGDDGAVRRANRSSIWVEAADGWRMRFHQGTPAAGA